ncbi:GlxA family transcriptional regulator [Shinella sp. WSJ-2]|uniref:GlxA family transcriptional regulator n=1 Tax=Shinella sp. WSJ-2 TaxID=2303749 RepID=UPI000E3C2E4B|nr:GlxA family transcriptional regulator [Shinella sp. WSJ-2]RFZ86131.1 GlxA family transcriptional regulator [Shinella sp. WSJ-2]
MRSVAVVVFPGVQAIDVSGPMDVFEEANAFLPQADRYKVEVVGPKGTFTASNGMRMEAHRTYDEAVAGYDLVLVAGGPKLPDELPDTAMLDCIRRLSKISARTGSVCTGAFVLGHAGLLGGKRVTTHWQNADALAECFPDAIVDRDRIYVKDGNLLTSAGVTAGIDLALAIVREDCGPETALAVAKRLVVVAQRQGGQSQFSPYIVAPADPESPLAAISDFVMANLRSRLTVDELADHLHMSRRSFARLFSEQTRTTPAEFVENARLDAARNLLEGSHLALKEIAYKCGFGSPHRMRQVFSRRLGVTPGQYRVSFQRLDD